MLTKARCSWCHPAACVQMKKTQQEFRDMNLRDQTPASMLDWHREVYSAVQVRGERITRRRTVYPNGKPRTLDLEISPVRFRVPVGMADEGDVRVLSLMRTKPVILEDEELKEANRASMLMHFVQDAIFVLPRADGCKDEALFTNLVSRQRYGLESTSSPLTLERVLDTIEQSPEGRKDLIAAVQSLTVHSKPISVEVSTRRSKLHAPLGADRAGVLDQTMPARRKVIFSATKDPCSGRDALLVLEHDVSDVVRSREQVQEILCSILPEDIVDDLCAGRKVAARHHPCASIFFSDIVGFTSICSRCSPDQVTCVEAKATKFGSKGGLKEI